MDRKAQLITTDGETVTFDNVAELADEVKPLRAENAALRKELNAMKSPISRNAPILSSSFDDIVKDSLVPKTD